MARRSLDVTSLPCPVLYGADGFVAFCTLCISPVMGAPAPVTAAPGLGVRSTLQAAVADRLDHLASRHPELPQ